MLPLLSALMPVLLSGRVRRALGAMPRLAVQLAMRSLGTGAHPAVVCTGCDTPDPARHYIWCSVAPGGELACLACGATHRALTVFERTGRTLAGDTIRHHEPTCTPCIEMHGLVRAACGPVSLVTAGRDP